MKYILLFLDLLSLSKIGYHIGSQMLEFLNLLIESK
jgi:hypothetical protein